MGFGGSKGPDPPPKKSGYHPPPPPSPEEIARREREKAEEQRWIEIAKQKCEKPEPPVAVFTPGGDEAAYKEYMRAKYEHECWENEIILLSRKLRAAAESGQPAPA